MKRDELTKHVDQTLSGLEWDARRRQNVFRAIRKEEKSMKKISTACLVTALVLCLSVAALAMGVAFSGGVDAALLAEKTLEEDYGVTAAMQSTFFSRNVEEQGDGDAVVTYTGIEGLREVLGEYTVTIAGGKASATWSLDGESTEGLLDARAWGAPQLADMMTHVAENHEIGSIMAKVKAKNLAQAAPTPAVAEAMVGMGEEQARIAAEKAGLTEEALIALAKDAVATAYHLTQAQREQLLDPAAEFGEEIDLYEELYMYYHMQEDVPLFTVMISLHQEIAADAQDFAPFMQGDGVYWVDINVETGVIEGILYDTQLGGNG